jgi:hypothetical protein
MMVDRKGKSRTGLVLALVLLFGVMIAVPAGAGPPEKDTQVILGFDPGPDFGCGFLLEDYQDLKITSWYRFDIEGNVVAYREFVRYLTHVVTNPANGRTLSLEGGLTNYTQPVDGPGVFTGSIGHFTIPGEGIVLHDAGRIEFGLGTVEARG